MDKTEQEPVAWMCKTGHGTFLRETITEEMANFTHGWKKAWKPLYTAPPQREWQGLTDEELRSMCKQTWVFDTIKQWAKIIEAKLREKNT